MKYKYTRLQIAQRAKELEYTWGQLAEDLFATREVKKPASPQTIEPVSLITQSVAVVFNGKDILGEAFYREIFKLGKKLNEVIEKVNSLDKK